MTKNQGVKNEKRWNDSIRQDRYLAWINVEKTKWGDQIKNCQIEKQELYWKRIRTGGWTNAKIIKNESLRKKQYNYYSTDKQGKNIYAI